MADEDEKEKIDYPQSPMDKELHDLLKAKYSITYVVSWEEDRVQRSLVSMVDDPDIDFQGVQVWDSTRGLYGIDGKKLSRSQITGGSEIKTPEGILDHILKKAEDPKYKRKPKTVGPIFVLCDLFRYLEDHGLVPDIERQLRVLNKLLRGTTMHIVIISPVLNLPTALEKSVAVLDYPLPTIDHVRVVVKQAKKKLLERKRMTIEDAESVEDEHVVSALLGLTHQEAEDALAKSFVKSKKFDIGILLDIKKQIIRKGELLEYVPVTTSLREVGGFEGLKEFVGMRKNSFSDEAIKYGLPQSKGVFLCGVQGCGKTIAAKAIAAEMKLALLKLDMGKMFGSLQGESEGNIRKALKQAESVAPCVLFIDEVDKSLAGGNSKDSQDGGSTKRVISTLLDWMMEKTSPVFVVAAANSLNELQAAFLRKGRFDEMFFVDLPNEKEREEIFKIHLEKAPRKRKASNYDLKKLTKATNNFSGAEIEGVIIDAMFAAFPQNRDFTTEDIISAAKMCSPLSIVMKEQIDKLREEAHGRMRSVNQTMAQRLAESVSNEDGDNEFNL